MRKRNERLAQDSRWSLLHDLGYNLLLPQFSTPHTPTSLVLSSLYILSGIILLISFILLRTISWIVIPRMMVLGLVVLTILGPVIPVVPCLIPLLSQKLNQLAILGELLD
jgi:hypothetical protein